jgi:cytochrome c oxidase subunit 4
MDATMEHAHAHKEPNYVAVWIWLGALTVIEVAIALSQPISWKFTVAALVGLAFIKALLVAMYFMHLRFERRTMVAVLLTPVVLSLVLFFGVLPDA